MYRLVIATLPLLFIVSQRLSAQVDSSGSKVLRGIIVDDSLAYTLPFVHLWNVNTKTGAISNESGEFNIKVLGRDTIVFSALGYYSDLLVVSNTSLNHIVEIRLKPKKYEIAEVVVMPARTTG